jgi:hypothetical protein
MTTAVPDPVTGLLLALVGFGIPAVVLMWAARERGQTRWWAVLGVFSLIGLLAGILIIDGRHPRATH